MSLISSLYPRVRALLHRLVFTNVDAIPFAARGEGVVIDKSFLYSGPEHIYLGDDISLAPGCVMLATVADIKIGNHVMTGPNVSFISGNHRTDVLGEYMTKITNEMKLPENDQAIIVEDDVWFGCNSVVLKGAHIGRGSIIHAGAVVSSRTPVPPYSIYINEQVIRPRFTPAQIEEHERLLQEKYGVSYPPLQG